MIAPFSDGRMPRIAFGNGVIEHLPDLAALRGKRLAADRERSAPI